MKGYYSERTVSPLCRKRPPRKAAPDWLTPLNAKSILMLAIVAGLALGGGIFLELQSKKEMKGAITAAERPEPHITLNVIIDDYSTNEFLIANENLERLGIATHLDFVSGNYPYIFYQMGGTMTTMLEDSTGSRYPGNLDFVDFDLVFVSPSRDIFGDWSFYDYYRSPANASSEYPIDTYDLDELLATMENATDPLLYRQALLQALGRIIWDIQAVTGICDVYDAFALDGDISYFDPDRWMLGIPNLPEMSFGSTNQTVFTYAGLSAPRRLNPVFGFSVRPPTSPYIPGNYFANLIFSRTFEPDRNLTLRPLLAAAFPVAIGSDDLIPLTGISADSPYFGKEGAPWGANPTINASQHNPNVSADDHSMFLLRLREGIPWQPGYGYPPELKLNVTADDLVWTLSYLLNDELPSSNLAVFAQETFGDDFAQAIEKINATTVKINLHGSQGDGKVANWLEALAIAPLPRHILDPTFNATPYGGAVGRTPDGTVILPYRQQEEYRYNTGAGPTPLVSCGPYYWADFSKGRDEILDPAVHSRLMLKKFDDWGGRGAQSLWNEPRFTSNNIETYKYETYGDWEAVKLAFLHYKILDGVDWEWGMWHDFPNDLTAWANYPAIQLPRGSIPRQKILIFNVLDSHLSDLYVRLAISHIIPRAKIVNEVYGGRGAPNELVGMTQNLSDYPNEEEWASIGPVAPTNLTNLQLGGHIAYDLETAWALMELAGYDMSAFREYYGEKPREKTNGIPFSPLSAILAIAIFSLIRFRGKVQRYRRKQ